MQYAKVVSITNMHDETMKLSTRIDFPGSGISQSQIMRRQMRGGWISMHTHVDPAEKERGSSDGQHDGKPLAIAVAVVRGGSHRTPRLRVRLRGS